MKTKRKIIIIVILVTVVSLIAFLLNMPFIKVRLYRGDRISGTFNMSVNNQEYDPMEASVEYENNGTSRLTQDGKNFSIKGGEYGLYDITVYLDNGVIADIADDNSFKSYPENTSLSFLYLNANNWNISNIDINVKLEKEENEWKLIINISFKYLAEDYKTYITENINKVFTYEDVVNTGAVIQFGL